MAGCSRGRPFTHPDVQVLEEDEEGLANQLELPRRESSIYLPEAKQREVLHFQKRDEKGRQAGLAGRSGAGARGAGRRLSCRGERGSRTASAADPIMPHPSRGTLHPSCSPQPCRGPSPTFSRMSTASSLSEKSGGNSHALGRCFPDVEGDSDRA